MTGAEVEAEAEYEALGAALCARACGLKRDLEVGEALEVVLERLSAELRARVPADVGALEVLRHPAIGMLRRWAEAGSLLDAPGAEDELAPRERDADE